MKDENKSREQLITELTRLRGEIAGLRTGHEQLKAKARELRESNQKLQGCAYLASHDLHVPLISMVRALDILILKAGPVLGAEEVAYLRSAKTGAEGMLASVRKLISVSRHSDTLEMSQTGPERLGSEEERI